MTTKKYDPWPSGELPLLKQRPELAVVMRNYGITEPREVIDLFERQVAKYCGSPYAVAVDSCTNALFLGLIRKGFTNHIIKIPKHTYISVPQAIIHAGNKIKFIDKKWEREYSLCCEYYRTLVQDCAQNFIHDSYRKDFLCCLSFQIKKTIPIGKGGMILTDSKDDVVWFRKARYEGRDVTKPYDKDQIDFIGWNMYMTPEDAARGVILLEDHIINNRKQKTIGWEHYTDLSKQKVFMDYLA
jgi:dTDP-4-amino-4,6-dideoxygalactose transaminase